MSGALQEGLRTSDVLFRIGGEEIVGLLRDATVSQAEEIAEPLRADIAHLAGLSGGA